MGEGSRGPAQQRGPWKRPAGCTLPAQETPGPGTKEVGVFVGSVEIMCARGQMTKHRATIGCI